MDGRITVLAVAAVLVTAAISSTGSIDAQIISAENRVLVSIYQLTNVLLGKTNDISAIMDSIEEDLLLKKKFYSKQIVADSASTVGIRGTCDSIVEGACAFNVESIQLPASGSTVVGIAVDGTITMIDPVDTPTNLLLETGIGRIGASESVAIIFSTSYSGNVVFTGEKPQDMLIEAQNNSLEIAAITIIKESEPEEGTDFGFIGDFAFTLDDDSVDTEDGVHSDDRTFFVSPDTYIVTEVEAAGWTLDSIQCFPEEIDVVINEPSVIISIDEGESVTCIFENVMDRVGIQ